MAISYDQRKQKYEAFDDNQKQKWGDMVNKSKEGDVMRQYMDQYNAEKNQTSNKSNFSNQNGTNGGNFTNNQTNTRQLKGDNLNSNLTTEYVDDNGGWRSMNYDDRKKEYENMDEAGKKGYSKFLNSQSDDYWGRGFMDTYSEENGLDTSKFNQDPGKITVQEGTAQQTGRPDYQASSEARLNEMKGNLDHYFATSPRMFSDRETFNRVFEYNNRESEAQRQLLDSYWKRKEDMDKASTYTSGESINTGMKNGEITTDQLNLLKEYNPEAYRKWQQLQEEEVKKRIVNDIVPPTIEAISGKINGMIEALGIQAQDALDIEGIYNDTMTKVGAYQTLEDCNSTVKKLEDAINKKTAIMNRYAASTGGTVSDALAAARMQKAIAPYNEQIQGLQYQYQDYSNLYSQKSATALQAANVRALQANENQRIWNQKCSALGFATSALSYRTPEENKQLELQFQQAMNDMSLLQQSKQNDLSLYNQYATSKLNNQLNYELTDLSVQDETQLKANLNNILSGYYSQYGDIIQRSQQQAIEDIIKYAKEKNIPVSQALTENFIKQLQDKDEYKQKIKSSYLTNNKTGYSKITLNGKDYLLKDGELVDMDFLDDGDAEINVREGLATFLSGKADGQIGGWCGTFVNDYLQSLGLGRLVKDSVQDKKDLVNIDKSQVQVGDVAIFDYSWLGTGASNKNSSSVSENSRKYGHVAIVTDVDWVNNTVTLAESNYAGDKKITSTRKVSMDNNSLFGFYSPTGEVASNMSETGYSESRIGAYDKYLTNGTLPSDAKLKSMGGLDRFEAEVEAYKADRGITTQYSQQAIDQVTQLRKEFDKLDNVQAYRDMQTYYNKILSSANGTAAGDMSLIFAYMKMLDPRSVVREGEFATAQQTTGIPERVVIAYNQAIDGTRLSDKQRREFTDMAKQYLSDAAKIYNQELARYQGYVTYGGDKNSIGEYATIPGVYNTNSFQNYNISQVGGSDIDELVSSWANM